MSEQESTQLSRNTPLPTKRGPNVIAGGLIGLSLIIVHALIPLTTFDLLETLSIIAIALAIPPLAVTFLNSTNPDIVGSDINWRYDLGFFTGAGAATVGIILIIWHVSWIAAVVFMGSGVSAIALLYSGMKHIRRKRANT